MLQSCTASGNEKVERAADVVKKVDEVQFSTSTKHTLLRVLSAV